MRVVIDTNVWVSALLNPEGHPARLLTAFRQQRFITVVSQPLMSELAEVLQRPRLARRFRIEASAVQELVELIRRRSLWVEVRGDLCLCRDTRDDMVLETALRGQAQYLVSRDDDLKRDLDLIAQLRANNINIVSVQQFLNILDQRGEP
ncbi:MAG: putative toxin-antitoxin system toxin component, PIN family [Fimbriimonadales bacterium]|nr:putative toxin-antitoxin system toxin component, PIN family [Fimbriimonadales bacterium]